MKEHDISSLAAFAYIGPFFFIGLISEHKNDPVLRYHLNQGLVLFIGEVVGCIAIWFLSKLIAAIPVFGSFISALIGIGFAAVCVFFSVKGALNAFSGKTVPLPVIGSVTLLKGGRVKR